MQRVESIIFSAPFDLESADELAELGVDCYKIASFDLVNLPLSGRWPLRINQ